MFEIRTGKIRQINNFNTTQIAVVIRLDDEEVGDEGYMGCVNDEITTIISKNYAPLVHIDEPISITIQTITPEAE
jgi:hypothetical protein